MSLGIVVVEANLRSGSLITARLAAADYGREVFALPGRVDSPASAGTHHLIKTMSAHLVESAEDVLEFLGDVGASLKKSRDASVAMTTPTPSPVLFDTMQSAAPPPPAIPLTSVQQQIVTAIGPSTMNVDELVNATALPPQVIMAELTLLQIRGVLVRAAGNRFAKK